MKTLEGRMAKFQESMGEEIVVERETMKADVEQVVARNVADAMKEGCKRF